MTDMNVLMLSRATLYSVPGGDTVQLLETAEALRKKGLKVDVKLVNDDIDYKLYDIIHFFNIIRPSDITYHVNRTNKKFVISTIFVDYTEFEQQSRKGLIGQLAQLLSADGMDYVKTIARYLLNNDKILDKGYIFKGQRKSIQYLLNKAAVLLPNSENEFLRLKKRYHFNNQYVVVPNAVSTDFIEDAKNEEQREGVLCVARIEALKNQLNLIKAVNQTDLKLTIIGKNAPNHKNYYDLCVSEAGSNVTFLGQLPKEEIIKQYQKHKVHVLPSWFETTGLSSLEAAAMGCNIVVTDKGDQKEYFENQATYCDPDNVASIKNAIVQAYAAENNMALLQKIQTDYSWDKAAEKTIEAYQLALN